MEARYILGIDPGLTGGCAFYDPFVDDLAPIQLFAYRTPVLTVAFMKQGEKRQRKIMDLDAAADIIRQYNVVEAFIEEVHSMRKQGVTSTFRFGEGYGQWQGLLAGIGIKRRYVAPQAWKKAFSLSSDKGESLEMVRALFPLNENSFRLKKDDGVAEASLIAVYGAHLLGLKPLPKYDRTSY